ncbi:MAG: dimethyl sulfoxide reductase anchor subunit family protein [Paracoccaceae bacterium]
MHPAPSVIVFTTFSGLGFGLLIFLGLGMPAVTGWTAFAFFAIAYACAVGGLIASTFHLGHPERAWKAFTQWKTSWLSREAVCAVLALVLMGIYGAGLVFFGTRLTLFGWLGALFSLGTVFTTSMIYAQLKTIPRWNMPLTPAMFMSLSIAGGALMSGEVTAAMLLIAFAGVIVVLGWMMGDNRLKESGSNIETATGLGSIGSVRAFEPPHTGTNYLLREFVHVVGRKHSQKLRLISLGLMVVAPLILLALPFNHFFALVAVLTHVAGVLVSRWLFFAEAEHVVGLYYGQR